MLRLAYIATLLLLAAATAGGSLPAHGQSGQQTGDPPALQLHEASRFWIEGASTVNRFTCHVDVVSAHGPLPVDAPSVWQAESTAADTTGLTIPVQRFDCGNDRMSQDLQEALQAQVHPRIRFTLHDASVLAAPDSAAGDWIRLEALGFLTVAGTERLVRVHAWGRSLGDGRYRVRGCKPLEMTYFGIDPPSKFLGMVQVHNRIEVHFDLVTQPVSEAAASPSLALTNPPPCTPSTSQ